MTQDASPVEWGAEIAVNGKRPDGLADGDRIAFHSAGRWYGYDAKWLVRNLRKCGWSIADRIRLPADHPYYRPEPIAPDLVARMVALVENVARDKWGDRPFGDLDEWQTEARAIAALLPEPTDPDVELAEQIAVEHEGALPRDLCLAAIRAVRQHLQSENGK